MENRVYCIIVTYNAMRWIDKCLLSLRESNLPVSTVIVDNCSSDDTVKHIEDEYPEIILIKNRKNKGFGQANNQGIEVAYANGATHFFLLNQDAWVHKDTIDKLVNIQNKHSIELVSPIHLNGKGDLYDYEFFNKIVLKEYNLEYVSDIALNTVKEYYKVFKINAAAWMISRKAIEQIGGFDPIYFHYGEDGNYCQRIKYHNGVVAFVPNAFIHHDRIRQGNMKVFKKQVTIMGLLYNYTDINTPMLKPTKSKCLLFAHNLKLLFVFLFTFQFKNMWNLIVSHIKFAFSIRSIINSRKQNKRIAPNWLNIKVG